MSYMYISNIICIILSLYYFLIFIVILSINYWDEEISVEFDLRRIISNVLFLCIFGESLIVVWLCDLYYFKIY